MMSLTLEESLGADKAVAKQLRFLLSQAPIIDAPFDPLLAAHAVTKFAYVHPKTLARLVRGRFSTEPGAAYYAIGPSRTKWIATSLMPEERVIYSSNAMPGIEKRLG